MYFLWNSSLFTFPLPPLIYKNNREISSVQWLNRVWLFVTPWITGHQASLSITNSRSSLKLMSIKLVMPSSHLILCRPLLLLSLIPPSIKVFSNKSTLCMTWPKYWSFSLSISPSNEHTGLISFRMDWLDVRALQGTLKSLLQHHHSEASLLWSSAFFMVQLSYQYISIGKTIALSVLCGRKIEIAFGRGESALLWSANVSPTASKIIWKSYGCTSSHI